MQSNTMRAFKWIGGAILAIFTVWAIRKGYQDSRPTRGDLEIGRDLQQAAARAAQRHNIAEDNVAVMFKNRDNRVRVVDSSVETALNEAMRNERAERTGREPLRAA